MEELRDDSGAFFCIHPFSDFGLWMEQGWGELRIAPLRIVAALVEDGYADDRRYAAAFAREKSSITGWGPVKIRMALSAKGISGEMADEALLEIDSGRADAKLEKLLQIKWRTLSEDPQGRLKLIRFALSRGYDYESVRPIVEEITR